MCELRYNLQDLSSSISIWSSFSSLRSTAVQHTVLSMYEAYYYYYYYYAAANLQESKSLRLRELQPTVNRVLFIWSVSNVPNIIRHTFYFWDVPELTAWSNWSFVYLYEQASACMEKSWLIWTMSVMTAICFIQSTTSPEATLESAIFSVSWAEEIGLSALS